MVEADVLLLGEYGDAGLIIRANDEAEGVDAYRGYLSKDASLSEIVAAVSAVSCGGKYFPPGIAARIAECEPRTSLSPREVEILEMVAKGLTNKEIGRVLQISHYTVRNHINHISEKLGSGDRTEAATVALQQGIINTTG